MAVSKWSGEAQVTGGNASTVVGSPITAALADGGFITIWQSDAWLTNTVVGQRYNGAGEAVGGRITFGTSDKDTHPSVVGLANGNFAVSWTEHSGTSYMARVAVVDGAGTMIEGVQSPYQDRDPFVTLVSAAPGTSDVVVAYNDRAYVDFLKLDGSDGPSVALDPFALGSVSTGLAYAVSGNRGGEVHDLWAAAVPTGQTVALQVGGQQQDGGARVLSLASGIANPGVAALGFDRYAVIWQQADSSGFSGRGLSIHGRILDGAGNPVGGEFEVETASAGDQTDPAVARLANGHFVVTWTTRSGTTMDISGQEFTAAGSKVGSEFTINTKVTDDQLSSAVTVLEDGRLVVTWHDTPDLNGGQVRQQILDLRDGKVFGDHTDNLLYGNNVYDDRIAGRGGNDTLYGLEGDDKLIGGAGDDEMRGGKGDDTYWITEAGDQVIEHAGGGHDTVRSWISHALEAQVEDLELEGKGAFWGTGNGLDNRLFGNSGANRLDGMAGADLMRGHGGNDTYVVDDAGDVVQEAAGNGWDRILSSISRGLSANVEGLTLTGTDDIDGASNELDNVLRGNAGANRIRGYDGDDRLVGGAGADRLDGGNGADYLAGDGDDKLAGGDGRDILDGNKGDDIASGGGGDDKIMGRSGNDRLNGGAGNDALWGGKGDDDLAGTGGDDHLFGSFGNDRLSGGSGDDVLAAGGGNDLLNGGYGNDTMGGGSGNDTLFGDQNDDLIDGGSGDDVLDGGNGSDDLRGGDGNDRLDGGGGRDLLRGGSGADTFVFSAAADSGVNGPGDRIMDFEQGIDIIDLSGIDADQRAGALGNQALTLLSGAAGFSHTAGELRLTQSSDGTQTVVEGDVTGDGLADFRFRLDGVFTLSADDFLL